MYAPLFYRKTYCHNGSCCHQHNGHRKLRDPFFRHKQDNQRHQSQHKRRHIDLAQCGTNMRRQFRKFAGSRCSSHEFRRLHQDNSGTNSCYKSSHNRCRYETYQFPCFHNIKSQKPHRHHKGDHRHHFHGLSRFALNIQID